MGYNSAFKWLNDYQQDIFQAGSERLTQPPIQWVPGVKRPGRGVDRPLPQWAEIKNG